MIATCRLSGRQPSATASHAEVIVCGLSDERYVDVLEEESFVAIGRRSEGKFEQTMLVVVVVVIYFCRMMQFCNYKTFVSMWLPIL